jgi:hypothetical protein
MTTVIEYAFTDWLSGLDPTLPALPGTNAESIPNGGPVIIVTATDIETPILPLYLATVEFSVRTPSIMEDSVAAHSAACATLLAAIETPSPEFPAGYTFNGFAQTGVRAERDGDSLVTTTIARVGFAAPI